MILDNCYEGKEEEITSTLLSDTLKRNISDTVAAIRFLNQFHEPNMVFFSTTPGNIVPVVADPTDPSSDVSVGPLARRLLLVLNRAKSEGRAVTLQELLSQMTSPSLDKTTRPAVTFAQLTEPQLIVFRPGAVHKSLAPIE